MVYHGTSDVIPVTTHYKSDDTFDYAEFEMRASDVDVRAFSTVTTTIGSNTASDMLKDILPTVDNLALALEKAENKEDPFVKGVQLVYDGLVKMLSDHGAAPLDSLGEPLDTNFHEAIATLPSPDVPDGHVMTEVKRGWLLNGKVLRAAQVVVSSGKGE